MRNSKPPTTAAFQLAQQHWNCFPITGKLAFQVRVTPCFAVDISNLELAHSSWTASSTPIRNLCQIFIKVARARARCKRGFCSAPATGAASRKTLPFRLWSLSTTRYKRKITEANKQTNKQTHSQQQTGIFFDPENLKPSTETDCSKAWRVIMKMSCGKLINMMCYFKDTNSNFRSKCLSGNGDLPQWWLNLIWGLAVPIKG